MSDRPAPLLYSRRDDGHRQDYLRRLAGLTGGARGGRLAALRATGPTLFLMVEEDFGFFVWAAVLRGLRRRMTVGLLFRPGPALAAATLRTWAKRAMLKLLRRWSWVRTLTILPFAAEPRFATIADGWIDDLQWWDFGEAERGKVEALRDRPKGVAAEVRDAASGRQVVLALGRQSQLKGFDRFAAIYAADVQLRERMLFVAAGAVDEDMDEAGRQLVAARGLLLDRRLSDEEMIEAYAAADFAWCVYHESYDQASGIAGHAAQLGVPVLVRQGSYLERICAAEEVAHLGYSGGALSLEPPLSPKGSRARAARMRERSLRTLCDALWPGYAT